MLARPLPVWRAARSSRHKHYSNAAAPRAPSPGAWTLKSPAFRAREALSRSPPKASGSTAKKRSQTPPNHLLKAGHKTEPNTAPRTASGTAEETSTDAALGTAPEHIPNYHPKVRAIPFAFSPEHAVRQAGVTASIIGYSNSKELPNVKAGQIVSSLLAKYLPITGCKPLQPSRIQALYFPTWFVDAEVEAFAWFTYSKLEEEPDDDGIQKENESERAIVHFESVCLPGYAMDAGRVLIRNPPKDCDLARPFTPELAEQWGQEIMCLPFNTFPFDLIEDAQMLSYTDAVIGENIRFRPLTVKANFAAAYPILLPVYLLQYDSQEPWPPITVIMVAHEKSGLYHVHIPRPESQNTPKLPLEEYFIEDDYICHGPADNSDILAQVINRGETQVTNDLSAWLTDKLYERGAPVEMAVKPHRDLEMDDLRVREWTEGEMKSVRTWLETGRSAALLRRWMNQIDEQAGLITKPEHKKALDALRPFFKAEADKVQMLEEMRATQLPEWWSEWEKKDTKEQEELRKKLGEMNGDEVLLTGTMQKTKHKQNRTPANTTETENKDGKQKPTQDMKQS